MCGIEESSIGGGILASGIEVLPAIGVPTLSELEETTNVGEVVIPTGEVEIPAREVGIPAGEVDIPTGEVDIPAEIPADDNGFNDDGFLSPVLSGLDTSTNT